MINPRRAVIFCWRRRAAVCWRGLFFGGLWDNGAMIECRVAVFAVVPFAFPALFCGTAFVADNKTESDYSDARRKSADGGARK